MREKEESVPAGDSTTYRPVDFKIGGIALWNTSRTESSMR